MSAMEINLHSSKVRYKGAIPDDTLMIKKNLHSSKVRYKVYSK